jgi:Glycosyltransferase family 92
LESVLIIAIAAIFKNEVDSILEWVAHHRLCGFTRFFLADNGSSDGTSELLRALASVGIVDYMPWPNAEGKKPQLPAYSRLLTKFGTQCDLMAFIDADEFIVPMDGESTIHSFAERLFAFEDVSAVALNWANFGSAGLRFHEGGLVIERFNQRAPKEFSVHHHYKCLVRPQRVEYFENPHHPRLRWGRLIDSQGRDLEFHLKHGPGLSAEVSWQGARVNHYAVKSLEEFVLGKSRKGSASREGRIKHKKYFEWHDRNDEVCDLVKVRALLVRAEIERLKALVSPSLEKISEEAENAAHAGGWRSWVKRR